MQSLLGLEDRVALVTGAGQGIGEAIARYYGRAGARVAVFELVGERGERTAKEIEAEGGQAIAIQGDVGDASAVNDAVKRTLDHYGRLDVLVNNAGIYTMVDTLELDDDELDRMIRICFKGTHYFCRASLPHMLERGSGRIVNIASMAAVTGVNIAAAHYAAAKGAVAAYSKSLAKEFGPRGIVVNAIAPGSIDTPASRSQEYQVPGYLERTIAGIPLRRVGLPEDVAGMALFLGSDLGSYVNGQVLRVCGGWCTA